MTLDVSTIFTDDGVVPQKPPLATEFLYRLLSRSTLATMDDRVVPCLRLIWSVEPFDHSVTYAKSLTEFGASH